MRMDEQRRRSNQGLAATRLIKVQNLDYSITSIRCLRTPLQSKSAYGIISAAVSATALSALIYLIGYHTLFSHPLRDPHD